MVDVCPGGRKGRGVTWKKKPKLLCPLGYSRRDFLSALGLRRSPFKPLALFEQHSYELYFQCLRGTRKVCSIKVET